MPNIQLELQFIQQEIWKPIKGYEGIYSVSNLGRVKSHERIIIRSDNSILSVAEKILKLFLGKNGYLKVSLRKSGKQKSYSLHSFIAETFIPNHESKRTVNHINGIKTDNRIENLEWASQSENNSHAYATGLKKHPQTGKFGKDNPCSKPIKQLTIRGEFIKDWISTAEVVRTLGFHQPNIVNCLKGRYKTAAGFKWEYS